MVAQFPKDVDGIGRYFDRIHALRRTVSLMSEHQDDRRWWLRNAPTLPWRLWPLIRDSRATLSGVLGRLFGDHESVKLALASNLGYYTDNPDTMPFIDFAIPQASYLIGGGHYIRGGSQVLSDRLVAIIREAGGEAETGCDVDTILLGEERVRGVRYRVRRTDEVMEELAPVIFGNAAPTVLAAMLPAEKRPAFTQRYRGRHRSMSLWTMSIGLNRRSREFAVRHYSTSVLPAWLTGLSGFREAACVLGQASPARITPYGFVAYDQIDSGLGTEAPYLASAVGVDRVENWTGLAPEVKRARKERWMDQITADLNRQFPGIAGAIVHRELSTAETFEHYLNTPGGALYGFAPESRGFRPLAATAIPGLYLASAFTAGGGFTGAILGGGWAARAAMRMGGTAANLSPASPAQPASASLPQQG